MNLTKRVIEKTVENIAGKDVLPLVGALKGKKPVSEFKLASHLQKDINETRNMLYRLYNQNLVSSTKKKDKKKGWYVYYWSLNLSQMKYLAKNSKQKYIDLIKKRLIREKNFEYYSCSATCIRLDFERASNMSFKCPECGGLLHHRDNTELIKEMEDKLKELKE